MIPVVKLKRGREKSLLRRHPWVFSGAVAGVQGSPGSGETVEVRSAEGKFLAWGAFSPQSQIRVRVWSWDRETIIDQVFFQTRLEKALRLRSGLLRAEDTNAFRLVHGESDGLPGLIADRYADTLVVQFASAGVEYWREMLVELLGEMTGIGSIYERSDVEVRQLEGLPPRVGVLKGGDLSAPVGILENGLSFQVDIAAGHKTGFYLDQRANRMRVRKLVRDQEVLDGFSYTGGFTVNALAGGAAHVLALDSSEEALTRNRENIAANGLPVEQAGWMTADVFQALRTFRDQGRSFDIIILDPPKFAPTAAQAQRAARGYKDINLNAFKLLRPGGHLVTFSCSGGVSDDLFQKIVAGAALDAGVDARIIERLYQGGDHPVALNFPEGAYLKGLIVQVL